MALSLDHPISVKSQSYTACFLRSNLELIWSTYFGGENIDNGIELSVSESDNRLYFAGKALTNNAILDPNTDDLLPNYDFDINNSNDYWQEFPTPVASFPAWAAFFDISEVNEFLTTKEFSEVLEDGISVYPNPFRNEIHIRSTKTIEKMEVFDLSGKLIISKKGKDATAEVVDLSGVVPGTYLIRVTTKNAILSKKLIKL